jgi:hypothetical protein
MVQLYTGITSHYTKVYPMSSEKQIPDTLNQLLTDRGAPNNIKNDCAKAETSKGFHEILRYYKIGQYLSCQVLALLGYLTKGNFDLECELETRSE